MSVTLLCSHNFCSGSAHCCCHVCQGMAPPFLRACMQSVGQRRRISTIKPLLLHVLETCPVFSRRMFCWLRLLCRLLLLRDWLIQLPAHTHMGAEMRVDQHVQVNRSPGHALQQWPARVQVPHKTRKELGEHMALTRQEEHGLHDPWCSIACIQQPRRHHDAAANAKKNCSSSACNQAELIPMKQSLR